MSKEDNLVYCHYVRGISKKKVLSEYFIDDWRRIIYCQLKEMLEMFSFEQISHPTKMKEEYDNWSWER